MNATELARKLKMNTHELLEILPELGFDVGKKAIKIDDKVARKILDMAVEIKNKIEAKKTAQMEEFKKLAKGVDAPIEKREVTIPSIITVRDFASLINQPVNQVIKELMKNGVLASLNERIDFDTAAIIADEFGVKLILSQETEGTEGKRETIKKILEREEKADLQWRPPVVVVMGHVDHGKTKLLDTIRTSNVVEGEAGGITQHIGAYQAKRGEHIMTFIDTPGHEAFTAMRSRGAKIADIAILVIAANDSIKPQTTEAIKIIQQSNLPMIVAINKIDLPDANIEKVKQDLASISLTPEDWGGKTIIAPISAKQNIGIEDLLDTILLVAEMEKEKIVANPDSEAVGTIIDSRIDKGEGPVATVLVQNGTLRLGDNLLINDTFFGKARALKDYNYKDIKEAGPSVPVKIIGLKYAPQVGDILEVSGEIKRTQKKAKAFAIQQEESIVSRFSAPEEEGSETGMKKINLIIKADVLGSLEAISESLEKIDSIEIKVKIIQKGLGNITDTDINLAESSQALVIGFNVKATPLAADLAREKKIEVLYFDIIYKLIETVKDRMSQLLAPEIVRKDLGKVEVLAIFKKEAKNTVVGGRVVEGLAVKGAKAELVRKKEIIDTGEILELQAGKQNVNEVVAGQECGINFVGRAEINKGDILQIFQTEEVSKKIK